MADIKQIQVDGIIYNIKDEAARDALTGKQDAITAVVSPTVTEDGGDPSASVEFENGELSFSFSNLKGDTGETGPQGPQGDSVLVGQGDLPLAHVPGQDDSKAMSQKGVSDLVVSNIPEFSNNGEYINSNGRISSASGYSRTDAVKVKSGQVVKYKGRINEAYMCIGGYSSDSPSSSTFVQVVLPGGTYKELTEATIPDGVDYIVAASSNSDDHLLVVSVGLRERVEKIEKEQQQILNDNETIKTELGDDAQIVEFEYGGYIETDGDLQTDTAHVRTSYIEVQTGLKVFYKGKIARSIFPCVAAYDENYGFIKKLLSGSEEGYSDYQIITIPDGVKYIVAASTVGFESELIVGAIGLIYKVKSLQAKVSNLENTIGRSLLNEYKDKTINWIGDSIVAGNDFDEIVANYFEMTLNDYGINGSTIAADAGDTRDAICLRYGDMDDDADVVVVSAGTNDYQYNHTPIGTINDIGTSTFYGALKTLCEGLIAKYPTKLVFFTTPIKRSQSPYNTSQDDANGLGYKLSQYADIIKEVCSLYSIPVCDLWRECYLNPNMAAQASMFDNVGTHPDNAGRQIMARRVRGFMKQLI